jgi:NhaP-type Na+/H+ or K+/H+ antiporter
VDNIETIITVTVPWASYLIAFPLKLSGIVCIMFCGIAMGRYALPNLSGHGHHVGLIIISLVNAFVLPRIGVHVRVTYIYFHRHRVHDLRAGLRVINIFIYLSLINI